MDDVDTTPDLFPDPVPDPTVEPTTVPVPDLFPEPAAEPTPKPPSVKHLVLSSGVTFLFTFYGLLRELDQQKWLNIRDIESFHATSAGTVIATMIAVWRISEPSDDAFDWKTLDNYFINRPWNTVFHFAVETVVNSYKNCGLFGIESFKEILRPLFAAKDLNIDTITMKEFYEASKVELHFFTVKLETFEVVDVSWRTHPEWRVLDAVYASSCAPMIFSPCRISDTSEWYVDGAMMVSYPITQGLKWCNERGISRDQVLGINITIDVANAISPTPSSEPVPSPVPQDKMTLMEYFNALFRNLFRIVLDNQRKHEDYQENGVRPWTIEMNPKLHVMDIVNLANSKEERLRLIELGVEEATRFRASP